jgi:hypothetical protein
LPPARTWRRLDEHSLQLDVVTPQAIALTRQVHAAVLMAGKTAAILSAVLAPAPLKEADAMPLVKGMLEPPARLVLQAACQPPWPCYGNPAVLFHDRGQILPAQRARQGLGDRLGIISEPAPP